MADKGRLIVLSRYIVARHCCQCTYMYLDTFFNLSNVTVTYLDALQIYLNFKYISFTF